VRVERLRLEAFGSLAGLDTGEAPLPGLVVVLGPNEAGKSTVFHFLVSMLYGFYPASRDNNPYAPWDGSEPGGALDLRLDGGGCAEVERRLLSQPTGRLTIGGTTEELRNRTLPWAEHVPRAVFRQVFALTLGDLAGLDDETWGRVQDRIVGSMGATDLQPARRVIAELEQEAGELWRPTRRGNQRIRDVQRSILSLRSRRMEAADRDRRLREHVAEAEAARDRLQEARGARQLARIAVDRVQELLPVRAQLGRIDSLRAEAGPAEQLRGLPDDPVGELAEQREHIALLERRLDELRAEHSDPEAAVAAFGPREQALVQRGDEVARFLSRAAGLGPDRARLAAVEQESKDLVRRLEVAAATVLAVPWKDAPEAAVAAVSVAELRARLRRLDAVRQERRVLETAAGSHARRRSPIGGLVAGAATLAAGGLVLGVGLTGGGARVTAVGALAAAIGLALLVAWLLSRSRSSEPSGTEAALRSALVAEEEARTAVAALLHDLSVLPSLLDDPRDTLVTGLERIQELLRDRAERTRAAEEMALRIADVDTQAQALAAALALEDADGEAVASLVEREARRAERVREAALAARRELGRIEREEARVLEQLAERRAALDRLAERLRAVGDGDVEQGAIRARGRIRSAARADQLQEELERARPDLEDVRLRIERAEASGEGWTAADEDLARLKARVEELTAAVEALARRVEGLERDIAHLGEAETVDAVDGEIAALQEEEQALLLERDRRWLLARVLRQADRRFREEHQPDLLRRASAHLSVLTDGRYDRVLADETSGSGSFQVLGPGLPGPILLAPPMSTGTLEQAYLALRLAIVDHLDQGLERLPLFVDEVLVNWDRERRTRGMKLLAAVARHRQVFVFTCHPEVAHGLETQGARVIPVGPAG